MLNETNTRSKHTPEDPSRTQTYLDQTESPIPPEETEPPFAPVHPDRMVRVGVGLGAFMIILAIVWVNGFRGEDIRDALRLADAWQILPGLAVGAVFSVLVWQAGRQLKATRAIVTLLEQTLDLNSITFRHVVLFSLLAALPEELLFRGAVQTSIGILAASLIFGALHAVTRLYFAYATAAGLLLGILYALSNTLWLPIGVHFSIDFVMFIILLQRQQHKIL